MENKKKTSVWLIVLGGVLAAYGGYLLNGIWEQGIDINTFMERLNMVMARPFGNYFNDTTFKIAYEYISPLMARTDFMFYAGFFLCFSKVINGIFMMKHFVYIVLLW